MVLILAGSLFILSQFYRSSVAVIAPDLIDELGLDSWELSTVSASFFYAFALMQIPVGVFLDSVGSRITMTLLTLVAAAGALVFSMGDSYWPLSFGRMLLGVGMACNLMGTLKLITAWFKPKHFALLSAVIMSAGTAGNIAAATPLVLMVHSLGWRNSFTAMAGLTFVLAIVFFFLVGDRPGVSVQRSDRKSDRPSVRETLKNAKILFSGKDFWIISFSTFCRYGIFAAVQGLWAGPYLMTVAGLPPVTAGNILLLMSIGLIIGSPLSSHLSDAVLVSRKKVIISGILGMAAVLWGVVALPVQAGEVALSILFFTFGLFSSAGQLMYAHIKEQVPIENAGMAMTGVNFFTMVGVAVFLQGLGSLMKWLYPDVSLGAEAFKGAFIFCGICLILIGVAYMWTRETLDRSTPAGSDPGTTAS